MGEPEAKHGIATIVFKSQVLKKDFEKVAESVGLIGNRRMSKAATRTYPRSVYESKHGTVTLVNDEPLELDYVEIDMPNFETVANLLRTSFPTYTMGDVTSLGRSSSWQDRDLAFRILSELHEVAFDRELCEILTKSIEDESLDCSNALLAASQLSWRQLRPIVNRAAERHGNDALGNLAWNMLRSSEWNR